MPLPRKVQNTFVTGEISKLALGRTDLEKYFKACLKLENFLLLNLGGATSRPGFRKVALTKFQDGRNTRLKTMYSTAGDAYLLELGDFYMRIIYDGAPLLSPTGPELLVNGDFSNLLTSWTDQSHDGGTAVGESGAVHLTGGALGANTIVNGTFPTNFPVTGWTTTGNVTRDGNGRARLLGAGATLSQSQVTISGRTYRLGFTYAVDGTIVTVTDNASATIVYQQNFSGAGTASVNFTAIGANTTIKFTNALGSLIIDSRVDNVTVRPIAQGVIVQNFATNTGALHGLKFDITGLGGEYAVKDTASGTVLASGVIGESTSVSASFTPIGGTTTLLFFTSPGGSPITDARFDNASITEQSAVPLEIATPFSHADVFDLHFAQIGDILHVANRIYPVQRIVNNNQVFTCKALRFDPPPSAPIKIFPQSTITPGLTTGNGVTFTLSVANTLKTLNVDMRIVGLAGGQAIIQSITDTTHVVADIIEDFPATVAIKIGNWYLDGRFNATLTIPAGGAKPVGKIITLTASLGVFTSDMVGYFIKANGGQYVITQITDASNVKAKIQGEAIGTGVVGIGVWSIEKSRWLTTFPSTVIFHEDRLGFGDESTSDLSTTDDYGNFAAGANDANAIRKTLASGNVIPSIQWLVSADDLVIGTELTEIRLTSGKDQGLTPAACWPRPLTDKGSAPIQAVKLDTSVIFVGAGRNSVWEMQFDFQSAAQVPRDITLLAEHIPQGNIVQLVRQRRPNDLTWFVNGAKQLCGLKLDYVEQVLAWQRTVITGDILSVEVVPQFTKVGNTVTKKPMEELYIVSRRTIGGIDRYFIERQDFSAIDHPKEVIPEAPVTIPAYYGAGNYGGGAYNPTLTSGYHVCQTDCSVTQNNLIEVATLAGLGHLIGETVQVVGDGVERGTQVVPSTGIVTIDPPAKVVDVGLPYTATLETVPPEFPGAQPLMGLKKRWVHAHAKIHRTAAIKLNGQTVDASRTTGDVEIDPFTGRITGDVAVENLGYSRKATITVVRDRPVPATVLAIFGELAVGAQ